MSPRTNGRYDRLSEESSDLPNSDGVNKRWSWSITIAAIALLITLPVAMYLFVLATGSGLMHEGTIHASEDSTSIVTVPDYFQTSPQIYPGPTRTGKVAPFLAQTDPAPFGHPASFVPNMPLETAIPITGSQNNTSIFQLMGHLSPYSPGPGFGGQHFAVPPGANISQVHVLHRHGSRYPTNSAAVAKFGAKMLEATKGGHVSFAGELDFLNSWQYNLGAAILVARGRQELFDSGVLHYYNYGQLYNISNKIIARTTSQDRMLKSAEYFMAGFFGLEWVNNATLEVQIEQNDSNTSLAGYLACPNSFKDSLQSGRTAGDIWKKHYLANATERFNALSRDFVWSIDDSYDAQTLCPYETVAFGYSQWCELFTFEEWQGFEYSIDLDFHGNNGFGSPTGRAVGIGYVQEFYARLQNHLYDLEPGATSVNYTLATMDSTFPLNQTLYFDFSHDTNIMSVLTAFGLSQFAGNLPVDQIPSNRSLVISRITPFAARVAFEIIQAPQPVKAIRPKARNAPIAAYYNAGRATSYVHLSINQRTVPLHESYDDCEQRDDGWCEIGTFMDQLNATLAAARYEYSCFANYTSIESGNAKDGAPVEARGFDIGLTFSGEGCEM